MATSILENIKNSFDLEEENSDLVLEVPKKKEELVIPIQESIEFDFKKQCPILTPHNEESIKDSIDTGFDIQSSLDYKPCTPKPLQAPLYKENYLSEFKTEDEKAQVRLNLGIPSVKDIENTINLKLTRYATKADVDKIVAGEINLQNYYTKEETENKILNIKLNLDPRPMLNSQNGVTSGGVWKHIDDTVGEIHRYVDKI